MREAALGVRQLCLAALGIVITVGLPAARAWAQADAGHAIAEKFAAEAEKPAKEAEKRAAAEAKRKAEAEKRKAEADRKRAAEERTKADESEMLANARREAEARRAEMEGERAAEAALEDGREKARLAAEAEEKREAEAKRQAETERQAAAQRAAKEQAEAERRAAEAAAQAKAAEERRLVKETREKQRQEVLARERAAALAADEARRREEQRAAEAFRKAAEDARRAEQERAAAAAEARRLAEQKAAEDARRVAEARAEAERQVAETRAAAEEQARKDALAAERDAENRRLLERLRTAREAYERRLAGRSGLGAPQTDGQSEEPLASAPSRAASPPPWQREPTDQAAREQAAPWNSRGAPASSPPHEQVTPTRVSVLLLMEPGNRGIRRHNKTADPVLCTPSGCYISNGADSAASLLPPRRALGFGRTWGARAGACSNSLGCVFRNVDLGALPAAVQPVDMRVLRHDRREGHMIEAASDCHAVAGRLTCRRPVEASSYVMWVVPETLAAQLGAAALETALHDGLPAAERAALSPDLR